MSNYNEMIPYTSRGCKLYLYNFNTEIGFMLMMPGQNVMLPVRHTLPGFTAQKTGLPQKAGFL